MFPMRNLRRMHPISTGEFIDGFESFKRFERHTGFELRAVLFPLCRHLPVPPLPFRLTQHSILITCPVFGVHYTRSSCAVTLKFGASILKEMPCTAHEPLSSRSKVEASASAQWMLSLS